MRFLAPLLVVSTIALFASGVAMGVRDGHALLVARRVHGPASAVWIVLLGVHVLAYLRRTVVKASEDVVPATRATVTGARGRALVVAAAVFARLVARAAPYRRNI